MKTKKISWQAIAIVVLALVLIASIALGVSGAWFQDRDEAKSQASMADAVTVRLKDPDTSKDPVSWSEYYKKGLAGALPGDYVIGKTTVYLGSDTPSVLRYNISAKVYTDDTLATEVTTDYISKMTAENISDAYKNGELDYYVPATETEGAKWETAADIVAKWKAEATVSLNALTTELGKVTPADGWSAKEEGKNYGYYSKIVNAEEATNMGENTISATSLALLTSGITIPTTVNNAAENWTIVITMEVEAIQAANLYDVVENKAINSDWYDDMPTDLQQIVRNYNTARKVAAA